MALSEVILIVMALLTVAIVAAGLFRKSSIPDTVILVIIGMVMAGLAHYWAPFAVLNKFHLSPELVFFVFLPALIFESGLNIDSRQLIKELAAVLMLAVPALILSTVLIGAGLWHFLAMNLLTALLFGALISATDPVAVIALFKELGAPHRLTVLVEGESLMNDATAIVVFGIILNLALHSTGAEAMPMWFAVFDFLKVFLGGIVCGILLGLLASELLARLNATASATLSMSIVLAYSSFIIAEHTLHVSGVMSAASAAIMLGAFGVPRLARESTGALTETWELIAYICNAMLFLLVGLSVDFNGIFDHAGPIGIAVLLVLIARAATVYSLVPITNHLFSLPRIGMSERHIMWWGGLKGGLAIAIVLSIPDTLPGRDLLMHMTLGVVLFTLLINAPTIRPFMARLGLDRLDAEEHADLEQALVTAEQEAVKVLDTFQVAGLTSKTNALRTAKVLASTFDSDIPRLSGSQKQRHVHILAIRTEMEELKRLYEIGVITQYTYHDMRSVLQRDRDTHQSSSGETVAATVDQGNLFLRLEQSLIRRMREQDWAAGLLSRYQNLRLTQRLQRYFASVLIAEVVLAMLDGLEDYEPEFREAVAAIYKHRLELRKQRLEILHREFPDPYQRFESRMLSHVALNSSLQILLEEHQNGQLGAKGYTLLQHIITTALDALPPMSEALPSLDNRELIAMVPFLRELSEAARDDLAENAQVVNILTGDTIIGEDERGDSMYIIIHGDVGIYRLDADETEIAVLGEGDFFGEMALLGEHVRSASVKARGPSMLLRLRRRDILKLAKSHPEILQMLREVEDSRRGQSTATV